MRLFIAINLEDNMKKAIIGIQESMMALGVHGNFSKPDNIHLTLAFIGEYPDPDAVVDAIGRLDAEPFELSLEGMGTFGRLFWVGTARSEQLMKLSKELRHRLAKEDIPFDRKKFKPHITILRNSFIGDGQRADARGGLSRDAKDSILGREAENLSRERMTVDHISLMRSDRGKHGMVYSELAAIPLK